MTDETRREEDMEQEGEQVFTSAAEAGEEDFPEEDNAPPEQEEGAEDPAGGEEPYFRDRRNIVDHTEFFAERYDAEREKRKDWEKLTRLYRKGGIIAAQVVEVRYSRETDTVSILARISDNFRVLIRDREFFTEAAFHKDYWEASERERAVRRTEKARACIGAWIPFVIAGMRADRAEDGSILYTIVGDRLAALKQKQERYFTGPDAVREGDVVTAEVLSVGEHFANLEVLGVECSVQKHEIDAFRYVTDCRDLLKPGDTLKVAVKRIHHNDDGSIRLNVSGATIGYRKISENNLKLAAGSSCQGIVKFYNREKGIYTVITSGGASVMVRAESVVGREILMPGDEVTVTVKRVYPNAAFGTAKRN